MNFTLTGPYFPAAYPLLMIHPPYDSAGLGPERIHACQLGVEEVSKQSSKTLHN